MAVPLCPLFSLQCVIKITKMLSYMWHHNRNTMCQPVQVDETLSVFPLTSSSHSQVCKKHTNSVLFMFRPPQPAEPAAAAQAASGTLPGETHAHCRRHPGRLRLGLHRINWAAGGTEGRGGRDWGWKRDMWRQVRYGTGRPAPLTCVQKQKTIQQKTKNAESFFWSCWPFLFWYKRMVSLKTIIHKKDETCTGLDQAKMWSRIVRGRRPPEALRLVSCVIPPSANRVTSHQSVVKLSVNCLNLLRFLLQRVFRVCKVSALVPDVNRNLAFTNLPAENHSSCVSHTFSRSDISCLHHLFVHSNVRHPCGCGSIQPQLGGCLKEKHDVQPASVMVEWSSTCWLKQAPHSILSLKEFYAPQSLFIFVPSQRTVHHFKCRCCVCGTAHSAMFSGCYAHMPCQTNTKPFTRLCARLRCCRCSLPVGEQRASRWLLLKFVCICQLISYLIWNTVE